MTKRIRDRRHPNHRTQNINFHVSLSVKAALREAAQRRGVDMSKLLRAIVRGFLAHGKDFK